MDSGRKTWRRNEVREWGVEKLGAGMRYESGVLKKLAPE